MTNEFLNNHSPWRLRRVPPAKIYFTDTALPPDGHIETDQALPADGHVEEDLDCSYLLRGLRPEATKKWFVWNENEKPRAIKVVVSIEKLCRDFDVKKWWWKKVAEFVKFKAAHDGKKAAGKYVKPRGDWPLDPCHPREVSLPGDLPAIYALLCRFHDWLPGFDQLFSEGDPAVVEFSSRSSRSIDIDFEWQFEQRPVRIEELEEFLKCVEEDIEANCVCRQAENLIEEQRTLDKAKEPSMDKDDSDEISHSKDFRSVTWHGRIYSFNKNQAVAIGLLWNAMERGEGGIHQNTIGESLDTVSKTYRLLDTFRQHGKEHPAWKEMIHHLGHCIYTLNKPV